MKTTTVYVDETTDVMVVSDHDGTVLELTARSGDRLRVVAAGGWELARVAAFALDGLCDPWGLDESGEAA